MNIVYRFMRTLLAQTTVCAFFTGLFLSGCVNLSQKVDDPASTLMASARSYLDTGGYPEAAVITKAILKAEPENKEAKAILDNALLKAPVLAGLPNKTILGSNLSDRYPDTQVGWPEKIAWYLPNRVLDLVDLITFEFGPGAGIGVSVYATQYVSLGAQASLGDAMIGIDRRHLSAHAEIENFVDVLPIEARYFKQARASTGTSYTLSEQNVGMKDPRDTIYQVNRDFWAIGYSCQCWAWGAFRFELHPVELYDLISGLFFIDYLNDDLGVSKKLKLKDFEKRALLQLSNQRL